jgi:hydroxymethylpyrimidine pyrophosphatase-like HAD family hydrolase
VICRRMLQRARLNSSGSTGLLSGFTRIRYLEAVAECEKKVREELGDHVSAARSQPYYLDVTHPAANKGSVVDFLPCVYLIPKSSIATLGDMPNDVLMFKKSGMSIAMGNSSKEVQAEANFVTDSNEEEGFAHAIERFVLH